MSFEGLANQFQDLNLGEAECLPFRHTEGMVRTLGKLDDIPRYLFRVFTPRSCGITDNTWTKSIDAMYAAVHSKTDLFARVNKHQVAGMINKHLRWFKGSSDNLVSWTSSLLFALVYIFHLRATTRDDTRDRLTFENIRHCITDTTCFTEGVFIRDMDLIRAYKYFDSYLEDFEVLRSKKHRLWSGHFYFGEYLSQGALKIEGKCEIISAQEIIDEGLYDLLPEFREFTQWEPERQPPLANPVIQLRERFYARGTQQQEISEAEIQTTINIGNLFGQRWRMPVATTLAALIPHRSDNVDILPSFRSRAFEGTLLTAKSHLKLTYEDDERKNCSPRKTKIVACDLLPEVQESGIMMRGAYNDYYVRTLKGKSPLPIFVLS